MLIPSNIKIRWGLILIFSLLGVALGQADTDQWVQVQRVNDGDTVTLKDGRHLRYLGINTPEIDYKRHQAQPFAYAARRFNRKMVDDQKIRLEFEKRKTDRFGRLLAYVFLEDGTFLNRELLSRGYGYFYPYAQSGRHDDTLLKAQNEAMLAKRGLWRDWQEPEQSGSYIGNRRSKRLHLADCPNGQKISRKNKIRFNTMWDAYWKGYAPAKQCILNQDR